MIKIFMQNGSYFQQALGKALMMGLVRHVILLDSRDNGKFQKTCLQN